MTTRLTISMSQIAPLIGLDNYNNFPKNTCELWRKYLPDDFKLIEKKLIQIQLKQVMIWFLNKKILKSILKINYI